MVANYEQFENAAAVTDEEIASEYEKNKDTRYLYTGDLAPSSTGGTGDKPGGEKPDADVPAGDKPDAAAPPADGATPATPESAEKPASDTPSTEAEPKASEPKSDAAPQSHLRAGLDGTELALADLMRQDAPAAQETPASETPAAAAVPPAETSAFEPAAPLLPTSPQQQRRPRQPTRRRATRRRARSRPSRAAPSTIRWKRSRRRSAPSWRRRRAADKMHLVLTELREQKLAKYGNERTRWEVKHEKDKTLKPPVPLDFDALAAENQLSAHTTKLLSAYELSQVEGIGESFVGERSLVQYAFGPLHFPARDQRRRRATNTWSGRSSSKTRAFPN